MFRRALVFVAVFGVAVAAGTAVSAVPAAAPPATAVRFPAGFTTPIYVGDVQVWPAAATTPAVTVAASPTPTSKSSSTTSSSTTMPAMSMGQMPNVDPMRIAARASAVMTKPYLVDQQYPYQPSDGTG